jgi:hypothetical protein
LGVHSWSQQVGGGEPKKTTNMKPIKFASFLQACVLLAALCLCASFLGCGTTGNGERKPLISLTPQSLENKSFAITRLVATKVLENNPAPKYRAGLEIARDDLKVIAEDSAFGLADLMEVVNRLPEGALGKGDNAIYIETGVLFFTDEIGEVAVNQPEQVQFVARGMARALDQVLAK